MDTTATFAQKIKAKYPQYQNVDDVTLVTKIVEKYPQYKSQISDTPSEEKSSLLAGGKEAMQQHEEAGKNYVKNVVGEYKQAGQDIMKAGQQTAEQIALAEQQGGLKGGVKAVEAAGRGLLRTGGAVASAAFAPITEAIKPVIEPTITKLASKPEFQHLVNPVIEYANAHPEAAKDIQNVVDIMTLGLGGAVEKPVVGAIEQGAKTAAETGATLTKEALQAGAKATEAGLETAQKVGTIVGEKTAGATKAIKNVAGDIVPSAEGTVNHAVTRALSLTQGDVKNIADSTGNIVGEWLANKNLIRENVETTKQAVQDEFEKGYKSVRDEIAKVEKVYRIKSVPRLQQTLEQIKGQIKDVAGLEDVNKEVDKLLSKKVVSLKDVQRAKELLDEHFSLYKVTGDVKSGVAKEGLANLRKEIKEFIEKEVKKNTGADISQLNNDVSTARSIIDAIEERSTRGLTQSNLKLGDLGIFGVGSTLGGGPLTGLAALAGKKIIESPAVMLRFAKFVDGLSDARKLKLAKDLKKGVVPKEIENLTQSLEPAPTKTKIKKNINQNISIKKTIPRTIKKVNKKK